MLRFADHPTHIQRLVAAAITAADPARLTAQQVAVGADGLHIAGQTVTAARVFIVAVGKAADAMARAAADALGERLTAGVVIGKADSAEIVPPLHYHPGSHPVPSRRSLEATQAVVDLLGQTQPDDLVLGLISGGASALLTDPRLPLDQWQALTRALLHSGCPINELNHIRQQFDRVKGGGLARLAAPATVIALILSDVVGNDLALIGSGPTVPTQREPDTTRAILDKYHVWAQLDAATLAAVQQNLEAGVSDEPRSPLRLANHVIGDVKLAAQAAQQAAERLGFSAEIVSVTLSGEARAVGRQAAHSARSLPPRRCLIYGGETTVTVQGDGYGGRNQELALAAAIALDGAPHCAIAAFSTDGDDGLHPPDAPAMAGAFVTGDSLRQAAAAGLDAVDYLARSDSYRFFQALGTGHLAAPVGTNVNDLLLILTYA